MDYPCVGCNEGWGQANPWGVKSCHETCKKYWNWLKGDKKMDKPLKDWTLGEIKAECVKRNSFCEADGKCPFFVPQSEKLHCKIMNDVGKVHPGAWDLSEPPRWTEQDKEDAKALKRLIPGAHHVWRCSTSRSLYLYDKYNNYILPLNDCFTTLPLRGEVMLDEIIGDEDNDS